MKSASIEKSRAYFTTIAADKCMTGFPENKFASRPVSVN